jgi:hypothetical protein
MAVARNPRNPDGRWDTGAWRFRSPAEEREFHDKLRGLGETATPEQVGRAREDAAFREDERVRDAAGIPNPLALERDRRRAAGDSFARLRALINAVRATQEFRRLFEAINRR